MVTQQTQHYLPRVYDDILRKRLAAKGAVLVEGPKWCGKTTTCERAANSVLYMANPVERSQNLLFAETQPSFLLEGTTPRLVDEWQIAPQLWDAVRFEVDQRNSFGQFILTGSSAPHISRRLEKIYVIEDMPARNPDLRSKTAIRAAETHRITKEMPQLSPERAEAFGIASDITLSSHLRLQTEIPTVSRRGTATLPHLQMAHWAIC